MLELTLKGTAFDRGSAHGRHFADRIRSDALGFWEASRSDPLTHALAQTVAYLDRLFPDINEEIRGIADGAGVTFEQAFLYNNRGIASAVQDEACSAMAFSRGGAVMAGYNKDVSNPDPSAYFIKRSLPDKDNAWLGYSHIGKLWGYGVNEKGLCTAGTSAQPLHDYRTVPSIGLYFVGPIVLARCATVQQAVDLILGIDATSECGNILLADAAGDMAVVEVASDKRVLRKPENGCIFATNFYASGEIEHRSSEEWMTETTARYATIGRLLSEQESASVQGLQAVLSSHAETGPVCRHGSVGLSTVFSFVADAAKRQFHIATGPPCENAYVSHALR